MTNGQSVGHFFFRIEARIGMPASPPLRAMALVLVLALAAPARAVPISSAEHKESWSAWVEEHRKEYKNDEVCSVPVALPWPVRGGPAPRLTLKCNVVAGGESLCNLW